MVRFSVAVVVAAALLAGACDKEEKPVSVPLGDVPLPPEPTATSSATSATSTATATAQYRGPGHAPRATSTKKSAEAPIDGCCAALLDKANKSKDKATKQLYDQAASICYRRAKQVRDGKLTRAEALAQVRSSLLGPAPAACH